ncbi:MAG: hypothetical protein H6733_06470 [Alphaproteobacteria bacterium]|nr:hypothetical protein [Alphaproteobacteria bacterium]
MMKVPGSDEVIEVVRGGIARTGEVDVAAGSWVRLGDALGVVVAIGPEGADVALVDGLPRPGDPVRAIDPPTVPAAASAAGRVLDALGRPVDGGPGLPPAAPPAPRMPWTGARLGGPWLSTGLLGVDALAPVASGTSTLLTCPSAAALHEALLTVLATARPGLAVLVAPALAPVPRARLAARLATLPADGWIAVTADVDDPPRAREQALATALSLARAASAAGQPVLVAVDALHHVADAVTAQDASLRRARGPFGWAVRTSQVVAALTDLPASATGAPITVLATAVVDRPGLTDHLDPWFDRVVPHDAPPGPGLLPRVSPADLPPGPLGAGVQPDDLARQGDRVRALLRREAEATALASLIADPEHRAAAARARARLARFDQRAGTPVDVATVHARVAEALQP